MPATLVCSSKPSSLNIKLIKFLKLNLRSLNQANIVFKFEVAHPKDASEYKERGINEFPVLINRGTSVTGTEKIIRYLKVMVAKYNKRVSSKTDDDIVDDFRKQALGNYKLNDGILTCDEDSDSDDDGSGEIQRKLAEAFQQRNETMSEIKKPSSSSKSVGLRNTTIDDDIDCGEAPANTLKRMKLSGKSKGREGMDDALMAQFFENQGI